ncbi:hypothetical protein QSH57_004362 [Fusarium oxysporum f. sp. vasinfectum]|nr:hypothetical protein QSH57_004362 [Fusarium oxysporum f. sp. vasinfectum]
MKRGMVNPYTVLCALREPEHAYVYDTFDEVRKRDLLVDLTKAEPGLSDMSYELYVSSEQEEEGGRRDPFPHSWPICVIIVGHPAHRTRASELRAWFNFPNEVRQGGTAFEDCFVANVGDDMDMFRSYIRGDLQRWGAVAASNTL